MNVAVAARRMVLVHGAWQGAWVWDAWRPELARLGWQADAVDLPGNGCDPADRTSPGDVSLSRYVDHVLSVIGQGDEPVVLVGHSGGGITVTQVAEAAPQRIACVVYLAGMMLPSGRTYAQLLREYVAAHPGVALGGIAPHLRWSADRLLSAVPAEAAQAVFLHDCDPAVALQAAAKLRPQPERGRDMAPHWTAERFGRVPRLYVEALDDQSLRLVVQRRMQALVPGAARVSIACGHVPQLVRARASAELVCGVLSGTVDPSTVVPQETP
ncbi:MAG: alpha/beta fold hydrolase [Variovorax sp.]